MIVRAGEPDVLPAVIRVIQPDLRPYDQAVHILDRHQKPGGLIGKVDSPLPVLILIKPPEPPLRCIQPKAASPSAFYSRRQACSYSRFPQSAAP